MIVVVKDALGRIKETREQWRSSAGVQQEQRVSRGPSDVVTDPTHSPRRRDGSQRPRAGGPVPFAEPGANPPDRGHP